MLGKSAYAPLYAPPYAPPYGSALRAPALRASCAYALPVRLRGLPGALRADASRGAKSGGFPTGRQERWLPFPTMVPQPGPKPTWLNGAVAEAQAPPGLMVPWLRLKPAWPNSAVAEAQARLA